MKHSRAAVLIALCAGLAACDNASGAAPAQPGAEAAPTSAATKSATRPATKPTTEPATRTTTEPAKKVAATRGTKPVDACRVTAATLQKASGLSPDSHRIDPDRIRCARRWATAGVIAVDSAAQGDGVILFEYENGMWTKMTEGSSLTCEHYGIPEEIGDQVGCHN